MVWGLYPGTGQRFSPSIKVQNGSRAHPTSYSMGTSVLPQGKGYRDVKVIHSLPPSAQVENEWSYTSTPPRVFLAWTGNILPLLFSINNK